MTKKLCIANWKMEMDEARISRFVRSFSNPKPSKALVAVAAPFVYLAELPSTKFVRAAQDVSEYSAGAYTGEVSAEQLKDVGATYCLVGHSERRIYFKETDKQVNEKIKRLLEQKIVPVICIGETAAERKSGKMKSVLKRQLAGALKGIAVAVKAVIAYEPVWAISTFQKGAKKTTASDMDIIEAHLFIKKMLSEQRRDLPVLYGGSVQPENSRSFLNFSEVDGVLVGGASRDPGSFAAIINNLN